MTSASTSLVASKRSKASVMAATVCGEIALTGGLSMHRRPMRSWRLKVTGEVMACGPRACLTHAVGGGVADEGRLAAGSGEGLVGSGWIEFHGDSLLVMRRVQECVLIAHGRKRRAPRRIGHRRCSNCEKEGEDGRPARSRFGPEAHPDLPVRRTTPTRASPRGDARRALDPDAVALCAESHQP